MSVTKSADLEPKDPAGTVDYSVDWAKEIGADVITASTWTVPAGLTKVSDSYAATATTVWLSGGTDGVAYDLTNTVTLASGRIFSVTFTVIVKKNKV